jgi:hypothetical protein
MNSKGLMNSQRKNGPITARHLKSEWCPQEHRHPPAARSCKCTAKQPTTQQCTANPNGLPGPCQHNTHQKTLCNLQPNTRISRPELPRHRSLPPTFIHFSELTFSLPIKIIKSHLPVISPSPRFHSPTLVLLCTNNFSHKGGTT